MAKVRGFKQRLEPFGATKARGKRYAAERALRNRIHEVEQEIEILRRREAHAHARAEEAERRASAASPNTAQVAAMRAVANMSVVQAIDLGLLDSVLEIAKWYRMLCEWQRARLLGDTEGTP